MNSFSNQERLTRPGKPPNLTAKVQALCEEFETGGLLAGLKDIYAAADSLADPQYECRRCARCCDQTIRPLAAYAVEAAYLVGGLAPGDIPLVNEGEPLCPSLTEGGRCRFYEVRMLGCRLFLPWRDWDPQKGCANYPHSQETLGKIRYLLDSVESLNQEFIWALGLHRDFEFDFLGSWSITTWFEPLASAVRVDPPPWALGPNRV